jgi:hypothetical protein
MAPRPDEQQQQDDPTEEEADGEPVENAPVTPVAAAAHPATAMVAASLAIRKTTSSVSNRFA